VSRLKSEDYREFPRKVLLGSNLFRNQVGSFPKKEAEKGIL